VLDDATGGAKIRIADTSGQNTIEFDATTGAIDIKSGATLSIESPMITIKGDGNVSVEAGGILTLKGAIVKIN
jgi:type VI secretion system secreted protein VgrG